MKTATLDQRTRKAIARNREPLATSPSLASLPEHVRTTVRQQGTPLREDIRSKMQSRLNTDFSQIRVHADHRASASASILRSQGYAIGNHIVIGRHARQNGEHSEESLIAHELTHVAQQSRSTGRKGDNASLEQEARHASAEIMLGRSFAVQGCAEVGVQCAGDYYEGMPGWLHSEILDPLQRSSEWWFQFGMELSRGEHGVPRILGSTAAFLPMLVGSGGALVVGTAKLFVPRNHDELGMALLTADLGPAISRAIEFSGPHISYGAWYLAEKLKRKPRLQSEWTEFVRRDPGTAKRVLNNVKAKAPDKVKWNLVSDPPTAKAPAKVPVSGRPNEIGRLGEEARALEVNRSPKNAKEVISSAAERRSTREQLKQGDQSLSTFANKFGRDGAVQVRLDTADSQRIIDHLFTEGDFVVLRESKNVRYFSITGEYRDQLRKDLWLLDNHPDAIVHWRIRGNISSSAHDILEALVEKTGGRFRFQMDDSGIPPFAPIGPKPTIH